jgi:hypothetical protein
VKIAGNILMAHEESATPTWHLKWVLVLVNFDVESTGIKL